MKHFLLFLLFAFFCSCKVDTREAWVKKDNANPVLLFSNQKIVLADSAKYSLKIKQSSVSVGFTAVDENNNLLRVDITRVSGDAVDTDKASLDASKTGTHTVPFTVRKPGTAVFKFLAVDKMDGTASGTYSITVFENLLPVARFSIVPDKKGNENDANSFVFDASQSKDQDVRFGGGLQSYQYTLDNGYTFISSLAHTPYSFTTKGRHTVKLVAVDNEGAPSEAVIKEININ